MPATRKKSFRQDRAQDPWVSLVEAARTLRLHRQTVLGLALAGELKSQRVAGRTVVTRDSVEKLAAKLAAQPAA